MTRYRNMPSIYVKQAAYKHAVGHEFKFTITYQNSTDVTIAMWKLEELCSDL